MNSGCLLFLPCVIHSIRVMLDSSRYDLPRVAHLARLSPNAKSETNCMSPFMGHNLWPSRFANGSWTPRTDCRSHSLCGSRIRLPTYFGKPGPVRGTNDCTSLPLVRKLFACKVLAGTAHCWDCLCVLLVVLFCLVGVLLHITYVPNRN